MQDRTSANSKNFSCNARPDDTYGSLSDVAPVMSALLSTRDLDRHFPTAATCQTRTIGTEFLQYRPDGLSMPSN